MRVRTTPVALFLIETVTPGITAPLASETIPESVAPVTWACAARGRSVRAKTKQTPRKARNSFEETLSIQASHVKRTLNARWPHDADVAVLAARQTRDQ